MACQVVKDYMFSEDCCITEGLKMLLILLGSVQKVLLENAFSFHSSSRSCSCHSSSTLEMISNFYFLYFKAISNLNQSQYANPGLKGEAFSDRQTIQLHFQTQSITKKKDFLDFHAEEDFSTSLWCANLSFCIGSLLCQKHKLHVMDDVIVQLKAECRFFPLKLFEITALL